MMRSATRAFSTRGISWTKRSEVSWDERVLIQEKRRKFYELGYVCLFEKFPWKIVIGGKRKERRSVLWRGIRESFGDICLNIESYFSTWGMHWDILEPQLQSKGIIFFSSNVPKGPSASYNHSLFICESITCTSFLSQRTWSHSHTRYLFNIGVATFWLINKMWHPIDSF